MKHTMLLVSDHAAAAQLRARELRQQSIRATVAGSAAEAVARWTEQRPDLIVIDQHAAGLDGIDICRRLRARSPSPLLLVLPAGPDAALLRGYQAGADECVTQPLTAELFRAKVLALLRRAEGGSDHGLDAVEAGALRLDPTGRRAVTLEGRAVRLTPLELRLLHALMACPGQPLDAHLLLTRVWGLCEGDSAMLKNLVYRLRHKIESDPGRPRYVVTAPGGYMFQPD